MFHFRTFGEYVMVRTKLTHQTLSILILLSSIFITFPLDSLAEEKPPTLSGRLINQNGEPIVDSTVILLYVKLRDYSGLDTLYDSSLYPFLRQGFPRARPNMEIPIPDEQFLREHPPYQTAVKDEDGNFIFTGIVPGIVQLIVIPDDRLEKDAHPNNPENQRFIPLPEIYAINFGKFQFYPHPFPFSPYTGAVTFTIKPGANISNIEIIMKSEGGKHQKISGRIEFKNGQPLVNIIVKTTIHQLNMDGTDGSSTGTSLQTDIEGNFEIAIHNYGIQAMEIDYMGLSSISELFIVKDRIPFEGLILTLNGDPSELSDTEDSKINEYYLSYTDMINFPNVWVINPDNGHAYKAIRCDGSRKDAETHAEAEEAHLVTITSEQEQIWLDVVYEGMEYWIGLKYDMDDSRWEWDTGEPFSYMNWDMSDISTPGFAAPQGLPAEVYNYVIMQSDGKWERDAERRSIQIAVIEKKGLNTNTVDTEE